jgi:ribosome-associated protein
MNNDYDQNNDELDDDSVEYYAIRPNKTLLKKEIAEILAMAEEICELSASQITEFGLPENIENAIFDAAKLGHNSARKRLLKYITAQLREIELEPVKEKLARLKNRSAHATREHHQAENWRDLLLADPDGHQLTRLIGEFPDADSQHIRQLQRNALKEAKENKPPKSARQLYKYLKELVSVQE